MDRSRTFLALAAITAMTATVGSVCMTAAFAEDFQSQGRLNDPGNTRVPPEDFQSQGRLNDPANTRNPSEDFQAQGRLNDPANERNIGGPADRRDPADARTPDDKASRRDAK